MAKILLVEDNPETLEALKDILQTERYTVDCVPTGNEALDFLEIYQYDVLIVDWEMPGITGVELVKTYRDRGGKTPVIMLTAKSATPDKISGLDSGADQYLTKPIERDELLGFIRASLRRIPVTEPICLRFANLELNLTSAKASCGSCEFTLSAKEISILQTLIENCRRIVTHEELRGAGWGETPDVPEGTVRVFLSTLREKLQGLGARLKIVSVRGFGYRLEEVGESNSDLSK